MRATIHDAALARDAGRFVWLALDLDKPANRDFVARHGVAYTPTLFVLDPADGRAAATQLGGLTRPELNQFLDRGERSVKGRSAHPADAALARGDELLGRGQMEGAAVAYRESLRAAEAGWPERDHAISSLTLALMTSLKFRDAAEFAASEAPKMSRGPEFATAVRSGFSSAVRGGSEPWAVAAQKTLEPLAVEAVALASAQRDDRFQLYQNLMDAATRRNDRTALARWGHRWLEEIDATKPADDDERSALDIARVDAASLLDDPARVLPALTADERAMPGNYNASLRLAQMEEAAKHYDAAVAACDRGLAHVTGPLGRSWLLQTKAGALNDKGDRAGARRALEEALRAAKMIGPRTSRENNVRRLSKAIAEIDKGAR